MLRLDSQVVLFNKLIDSFDLAELFKSFSIAYRMLQ
jgi:hypothetical protein